MSPVIIPSEDWGCSDLPHIKAGISLPALPFNVITEQDLLGAVSAVDSTLKVRIQDQCDSRLSDFGGKFWALLGDLASEIPSAEISEVYYRDRYLCSPIQVALLSQIVSAIGDQISDEAEILIDTMEVKESRYQPSSFSDNWSSDTARSRVITDVLGQVSGSSRINIRSYARKSIAHSRELKLTFLSGGSLEIFLDEGVSCWPSRPLVEATPVARSPALL